MSWYPGPWILIIIHPIDVGVYHPWWLAESYLWCLFNV